MRKQILLCVLFSLVCGSMPYRAEASTNVALVGGAIGTAASAATLYICHKRANELQPLVELNTKSLTSELGKQELEKLEKKLRRYNIAKKIMYFAIPVCAAATALGIYYAVTNKTEKSPSTEEEEEGKNIIPIAPEIPEEFLKPIIFEKKPTPKDFEKTEAKTTKKKKTILFEKKTITVTEALDTEINCIKQLQKQENGFQNFKDYVDNTIIPRDKTNPTLQTYFEDGWKKCENNQYDKLEVPEKQMLAMFYKTTRKEDTKYNYPAPEKK